MLMKANWFNLPVTALAIFFVITTVAYSTNGLESRELDGNAAPPSDDQGIKCTPSCTQSPPPPSPPPPSPPPPACPPPPSPLVFYPPPSPKKPPSSCCPAGPTPPYVYTTGPPGELYPIQQNFGGASRNLEVGLLALVSGFILAFCTGVY
ncbi:formin-like protein 16 isoform X2 [Hibiscus syriacus]|uniref:formin-like protein 16 isoform X2 n=1 Tax=Hibiscus syriacus TaxID=106335 RepID=UPI001921BC88|nr:formin-like protein 16 isoform X2 [Hibiscus syriacus]